MPQAVLLYNPFFNKVFDTTPLTFYQLAFAGGISLLMIIVLEFVKIFRSKAWPN
ncbi:cation transporting ATPase C-terminal domain-containing protein [Patescibacteria group bacterium]|nr:cation transporting ATPase C-terminal domain-containing protein [Patescibacteria group bacterium]